jgi:hypothetical protein
MNAYKGVIPTRVEFNYSLSNEDYTELTTGQQQGDIIMTTVEFNDSLGNLQDYTELTTGQQQADIRAGKDVDDSEYNYGIILVCKGYIGSLKTLARSCITSSHRVNK